MISAIASLVLAVLFAKTLFFAPLLYLISYWRKDVFLYSFLFYSMFLSYEFLAEDFYKLEIQKLAVIFATILLLEEGLNVKRIEMKDHFLAVTTILGFFSIEFMLSILIVSLLYRFYQEKPKKGVLVSLLPFFLFSIFLIFSQQINHLGSTASQAVVISSITAFICFFWIGKIKR